MDYEEIDDREFDDGNIGAFEIVYNTAVPMDGGEKQNFVNLQNVINDYMVKYGLAQRGTVLPVNGRIGSKTVIALNLVYQHGKQQGLLPPLLVPFDVESAAAQVLSRIDQLRVAVRGAPAQSGTVAHTSSGGVAPVKQSPPPGTAVVAPTKGKGVGTVIAVVAALAAAGLVIVIAKRRKKSE